MSRGRASSYVLGVRHSGRRQRQIMEYVRACIERDGEPPSYAMICKELGIGTNTEVCRIIRKLESYGDLRREGSKHDRRIRLAECPLPQLVSAR